MSREVSLFQGLPNGWQYFTDYETALSGFMERSVGLGPGVKVVDRRQYTRYEGNSHEDHKQVRRENEGERILDIRDSLDQAPFDLERKALDDCSDDECRTKLDEPATRTQTQTPENQRQSFSGSMPTSNRKALTSVLGADGVHYNAMKRGPKPRDPSVSPLRSGNWANSTVMSVSFGENVGESLSTESRQTVRRVSAATMRDENVNESCIEI
ncbi:hypothetical protein VKT23_009189 [Stygiomarasmius scandens]|uniref:Uncharacterized protein n=1 Tax=Marasmiellus scandens TaxID=2682957 RepID=A0ABR1JEQ5_9AGAR